MADNGVQRALGRIEATLEGHTQALATLQEWQVQHENGHHGLHGRGPGGLINRQNMQTTGIAGAVVVAIEALIRMWSAL